MEKQKDPVYSRNVIEFVAVANEYCKYAEHAGELKGEEILKILQRILPLLYIKASLLPDLEPVFEDGNEKFVTETDWFTIHDTLKEKLGTANDYLELYDEELLIAETPGQSSLAENMADIYQDVKDFLLLYQTGTQEVMNDAIWECRLSFENIWGQQLVNALKAIHKFIYSGKEIEIVRNEELTGDNIDTSDWIISKKQREFREDDD